MRVDQVEIETGRDHAGQLAPGGVKQQARRDDLRCAKEVRILVLDDDQKRHEAFKFHLFRHDVTHVYTCDEAIKAIEQEKWDIIFLDHDLEDRHYSSASDGKVEELEKTGYDVAVHIARLGGAAVALVVHRPHVVAEAGKEVGRQFKRNVSSPNRRPRARVQRPQGQTGLPRLLRRPVRKIQQSR